MATATAALANKVGEQFSFLSVLERLTPKADTVQAVDAGVKLVTELAGFTLLNDLPGDSVGDFASAVTAYAKEDVMRLAAWIVLDGVLPLGPDFISSILHHVSNIAEGDLGDNSLFQKVAPFLPGSISEQKGLLLANVESVGDYAREFVNSRGLTQHGLQQQLGRFVDIGDNALDYLAAALDVSTAYFEHTGTQTVARRLIARAHGEV
jgi:hypothetical protein